MRLSILFKMLPTPNGVQIRHLLFICIVLLFDRNKIMIYGSARTSYLKTLDAVHHQGLRLCLGAFRTSSTDSLYVAANEPPLVLRRLKFTLQYIVKLNANIDNHAFDCVFHRRYININMNIYTTKITNILNQSVLEFKNKLKIQIYVYTFHPGN